MKAAFKLALQAIFPLFFVLPYGWGSSLYWDSNSSTAGAGATPTGTWGTSTFWSGDSTGASATGAWVDGNTAVFSAGTDAIGTFTVTVANSFTATLPELDFQEGTVTLAAGNTGSTLALTGSGTVDVASGLTATINPKVSSGSGGTGLTKNNAGTLILVNGNNSYTGTTTVNSGKLIARNDTALSSSAINLNGGTLETQVSSTTTFGGTGNNTTISASSSFIVNRGGVGAGVTHTFGTLSIGGSQLDVSAGANATSGTMGLTFGVTTFTGSPTFNVNNGASASTILRLGNIAESGGSQTLTKLGTGILTLGGSLDNAYSGLTTVTGGTLSLAKGSAGLNAIPGDLTINGGTVSSTTDEQIADTSNVSISSGTLAVGTHTETVGKASGPAGSFNMTGGNVTIGSGSSAKLILDHAAQISGGTLTLTAASGTLQANENLKFNGGTIDFSSANAGSTAALNLRGGTGTGIIYESTSTVAALVDNTGGGSARVSLNTAANAVTVFDIANSANGSVTEELTIKPNLTGSSTAGIEKKGDGVLVLNFVRGASTYGGGTTLSGGTLKIGQDNSIGAGKIAFAGGILNANNKNVDFGSAGAISLSANSAIDLGAGSSHSVILTGLGTYDTSKTLEIGDWTGTSGSTGTGNHLVFHDALAGDFDTFKLAIQFDGYARGAVIRLSGDEVVPFGSPVPEPATFFAGALLVGVLGCSERRRIRGWFVRRS